MTRPTSASTPSVLTRAGRLAYRLLENMTESAYQGFQARERYRFAYL